MLFRSPVYCVSDINDHAVLDDLRARAGARRNDSRAMQAEGYRTKAWCHDCLLDGESDGVRHSASYFIHNISDYIYHSTTVEVYSDHLLY